jgi:hypothetical protein
VVTRVISQLVRTTHNPCDGVGLSARGYGDRRGQGVGQVDEDRRTVGPADHQRSGLVFVVVAAGSVNRDDSIGSGCERDRIEESILVRVDDINPGCRRLIACSSVREVITRALRVDPLMSKPAKSGMLIVVTFL